MDEIQQNYKNWIREEIQDPEVQKAKELFLRKHFAPAAGPSPWAWTQVPAFRLALTGCLALAILVKIGAFGIAPSQNAPSPVLVKTPAPSAQPMILKNLPVQKSVATSAAPATVANFDRVQIMKLNSQMGPTAVYQKHFPDVQVTVVWVFPNVLST